MPGKTIFLNMILLGVFAISTHSYSATYYLDDVGGDDGNEGTTVTAAWRSLDRISTSTFSPGEVVNRATLTSGNLRRNRSIKPVRTGRCLNHVRLAILSRAIRWP